MTARMVAYFLLGIAVAVFLIVAARWADIEGPTRFGLAVGCGALFIVGLAVYFAADRPRHRRRP